MAWPYLPRGADNAETTFLCPFSSLGTARRGLNLVLHDHQRQ